MTALLRPTLSSLARFLSRHPEVGDCSLAQVAGRLCQIGRLRVEVDAAEALWHLARQNPQSVAYDEYCRLEAEWLGALRRYEGALAGRDGEDIEATEDPAW